MKQRRWTLMVTVVGAIGIASSLGYGARAASQKKTVDERVAELETKVKTMELKLQLISAELSRTPKLGIQTAR